MNSKKFFSIEQKTPLTLVEGTTYQINGVNLESPFILTEQQRKSLECIINDFIHTDREDVYTFTLKGYAGTGKTSVINMVEQYVKQIGASIVFTATTHRAVEVMRGTSIASNVFTIHSFMRLKLHIDIRDYNVDKAKLRNRNREPSHVDFVVIDEASMIDIILYAKIIDILVDKFKMKVIFMGDPAQLKPIGSTGISFALRKSDLQYELTTVKRTSSVAIQSLLTRVRQGKGFSLEPSQQHCFTSNREEFMKYSLEKFSHLREDILSYRILCGTNEAAESCNDYFHKALFPNEPDENEYHVGELIMTYKNGNDDNGTQGFHNAMDGFILCIEDAEFTIGDSGSGCQETYTGYNLTILVGSLFPQSYDSLLGNATEVKIPVISKNNNWTSFGKYLDYLYDNKKQKDYENLMNNYYFPHEFNNNKGDTVIPKGIHYGYAMTVHKSQGGTYSNTGIIIDSFKSFEKDVDNYNQLLYVAFSRCKDSFVGLITGAADTIAFVSPHVGLNQTVDNNAELVLMPLTSSDNADGEEILQPTYEFEEAELVAAEV